MRHLTSSEGIEVVGQAVISFVKNTRAEEIRPVLEKHGLAQIEPTTWYALQEWLDVLNELSKNPDFTSNLVAIGIAIMEQVQLPPEATNWTLADVLVNWDAIYQAQHRGGDVGQIITEEISDTHYKTIHYHVYPDDMIYGVAYGMAKRFVSKGTHFKIYYDTEEATLDEGGNQTIIHVEW